MKRTGSQVEKMVIGQLEKHLLTNRRNSIYIALENVEDSNFFFSLKEIRRFDQLWEQDVTLVEIAKEMRRSEISVFFLSLDRVFNEKIKPRKGWSFW